MDSRQIFSDERDRGFCIHCGGISDTQDHIPSKIFLDEPYPNDLPKIGSCLRCNQGFSLDEEYCVSFLECVVCGSTESDKLERIKISHTLSHTPKLRKLILESCLNLEGKLFWEMDIKRFQNVILKLARGHISFELGYTRLDDPTLINIIPLCSLTNEQLNSFEYNHLVNTLLPEMGSQAYLNNSSEYPNWLVIQPNRYRYSIDQLNGTRVKIVLREYLACTIEWE